MEEIWKAIPEYEGIYEVSNYGQVRSLDRVDNKGRKQKGQLLKACYCDTGYARVNLSKNGKFACYLVHRLVAQAFLMVCNGKTEVNHIDGNKHNNRSDNLEWCSRSENCKHSYSSGQVIRKLTMDNVSYIRKKYKAHSKRFSGRALGKKFGVSAQHIYNIVSGRSRT